MGHHALRRAVATLLGGTALAAGALVGGAAPAGAATATASNPAPIVIGDQAPADPSPSAIEVSGLGDTVTGLEVVLHDVSHTCVKDLDVLLVGPDGTMTTLLSDVGENAISLGCNDLTGQDIRITDAGEHFGTSVPEGDPIVVRPSDNDLFGHGGDSWVVDGEVVSEVPAEPLSTFDGTDPNGSWRLFVVDDGWLDTGAIEGGWSVTVTTANRAPVATDQALTVPAGETIAVALGGVDPDPGESLTLTCAAELGDTTSGRGRVSGSGCHVTYRAFEDASGTDSFTFTVDDGHGGVATGTVEVEIGPALLPGCDPTDSQVQRYVCRAYLDLLDRPADPSGKAYWVARIESGEARYAILSSFSRTIEYRTRVVRTAFGEILGRDVNAADRAYWAGVLVTREPDFLRASLLGSPEFLGRAGGPDGWAPATSQLVLRRTATVEELADLTGRLAAGTSRTAVAADLLATAEADTVTVKGVYEHFLRRTPPTGEVGFWVGRLQGGTTETRLVVEIVASAEYFTKA